MLRISYRKAPWGNEDYAGPEHARWGQGASLSVQTDKIKKIAVPTTGGICTLTHPEYDCQVDDWEKWRLTYEGGDKYVEEYLKKFSRRETTKDFNERKKVSPIPSHAKGAVTEIKNAIFQRIPDTVRVGGPDTYQEAIRGNLGGVDLRGATIDWFIGHYIIAELLTMKKVGVFVDMPDPGPTLKDKGNKHPYFYVYKAEDIRNWKIAYYGERTEFTNILLRERLYLSDEKTGLPTGEIERFRHMWIAEDGFVYVQFYAEDGLEDGPQIKLNINRIPFVVFEITESLLKDVANAQIALLNLESSDISYALKSNFPFYTEQYDSKNNSDLLRKAKDAYTEITGETACEPAPKQATEIEVGATQGRRYPAGMDRPEFIAPPSEPMVVSMAKQKALKEDIRTQVHLALSSIQPKMASAESKTIDQAGLESGLSYIGLELEHGERLIASYWAMYEGSTTEPTINYPKTWSLKSTAEVESEIKQLVTVRDEIPSLSFKKETNKQIAALILGTRVPSAMMATILKEIQDARGPTSNPKTLQGHLESGIVGQETATVLSGYPADESTVAAEDHAKRLARIKEAQSAGKAPIAEESAEPGTESKLEKIGKPQRGEGQ